MLIGGRFRLVFGEIRRGHNFPDHVFPDQNAMVCIYSKRLLSGVVDDAATRPLLVLNVPRNDYLPLELGLF